MNGNGICQLQLLRLHKRIGDTPVFIIFHGQGGRIFIDFCYSSHIPVKNSQSFVNGDTVPAHNLPFQIIIVFNLHDLVSFPESHTAEGMLSFIRSRRVHVFLQGGI